MPPQAKENLRKAAEKLDDVANGPMVALAGIAPPSLGEWPRAAVPTLRWSSRQDYGSGAVNGGGYAGPEANGRGGVHAFSLRANGGGVQ